MLFYIFPTQPKLLQGFSQLCSLLILDFQFLLGFANDWI